MLIISIKIDILFICMFIINFIKIVCIYSFLCGVYGLTDTYVGVCVGIHAMLVEPEFNQQDLVLPYGSPGSDSDY